MFTFPIESVRKVIARGKQDAAANGGFRIPYNGTETGEGDQPGFWLVGDQGIYIMSNGKLADGQKPLVVYSTECHPHPLKSGASSCPSQTMTPAGSAS
jgi:hypothetical protein